MVFLFFAILFGAAGFLMLVVPMKYPKLLAGILNGRVMRRQTTVRDKELAIRTQGLIALTVGAFFTLFLWALS
jgi:hypothetical protein